MTANNQKEDLENLLDDALNEFDKVAAKNNTSKDVTSSNANTEEGASSQLKDDPDAFFLEQAKLLADRMNTVFGGTAPDTNTDDVPTLPQDPEQLLSGFKKMAEAAAMTLQGENPANDEEVAKYSDTIAQALKGLQMGTDNLNAQICDNDVASMFSGLNLDGSAGEGDNNMFLPFMEGMMQSLLSAEILLPSINELLEKYPKYLSENADKLKAEDKSRYEKQLELYKTIAGHLELERPEDTATEKREKFKVVLDDMRKLQEYGQPPEEILAETAGDLPLMDAATGGPQCPTM